jgi:hypothetical protein
MTRASSPESNYSSTAGPHKSELHGQPGLGKTPKSTCWSQGWKKSRLPEPGQMVGSVGAVESVWSLQRVKPSMCRCRREKANPYCASFTSEGEDRIENGQSIGIHCALPGCRTFVVARPSPCSRRSVKPDALRRQTGNLPVPNRHCASNALISVRLAHLKVTEDKMRPQKISVMLGLAFLVANAARADKVATD